MPTHGKREPVSRQCQPDSLARTSSSAGAQELAALLRPGAANTTEQPRCSGSCIVEPTANGQRIPIRRERNSSSLFRFARASSPIQCGALLGPDASRPSKNPGGTRAKHIIRRSDSQRIPISREDYGCALICRISAACGH